METPTRPSHPQTPAVEGFIEHRRDALPVGGGIGVGEELFHGLPFVRLPAAGVAQVVKGRVARGAVKPASQRAFAGESFRKRARFTNEIREDALGNFV